MTDTVRYELDGYVAILTLNRPETLNAVNTALADVYGKLGLSSLAEQACSRAALTRARHL